MKKTIGLLLIFLAVAVTGCGQEAPTIEKENESIDSGGLVSPDQRVVQASLVDDEIWGVLKDFNDPSFSSIVCYQMTDQLMELNTDTPYEVISDEPLQLGMETAIAGNNNLISFQDDSLFLAYHQETKEVDFQNLKHLSARAYSDDGGAYVDAEDQVVRIRNSMNQKLLWEAED